MNIKATIAKKLVSNKELLLIIQDPKEIEALGLDEKEQSFLKKKLKDDKQARIDRIDHSIHVYWAQEKDNQAEYKRVEGIRKHAASTLDWVNRNKGKELLVSARNEDDLEAAIEGLVLRNYQFLKYFKEADKKKNSLNKIKVHGTMSRQSLTLIMDRCEAVYETRTLVNEPLSFLTAPQLVKEIKRIGKRFGFKVDSMGRKKIEALKMGGLLAVNRGSIDEPTFSILEWKPKKATNKKPIVLVGKGVVYDTGGLSLKPTPNSMDFMKSDMGGAATMIGTMAAVAAADLDLHVIALIPATDNRPGGNAYAPGDVIKMYDGTTVEVLNTDAEGRMLLADALAYSNKYKPELVIDAATLTGAAVYSIGTHASCIMGNADDKHFDALIESGYKTHERCARMPFWEEYGEEMKSDIADLKNLGGPHAGQITAGKFLENFTDFPYIHIDIAGPAYYKHDDSYRGKYGTGYGVRLLFDFLRKRAAS